MNNNVPQDITEVVEMIDCPRCGQHKEAAKYDKHICVDCANAENARYTRLRMHQEDWISKAKEAGIDPWLQQPAETPWEYTIWTKYRDSYPGKKPTYGEVAKELNTTYNVVKKVAQRWSFPIRMQLWIAECDRFTMLQRRNEILDMNAQSIDMAKRLRDKLSMAIDSIDPAMVRPSEIGSLLKIATELEQKARLDTISQEELRHGLCVDGENPDVKRVAPKTNDLSEVVNILVNAGALGNITQIGVRETTTTTREVVARDDIGNTADIIQEE
jgi:hypothetical protein